MSEDARRKEQLVQQAAGIVAAAQGKVKIVESMKIVGFTTPERKNMTTHQQVRRKARRLATVQKGKQPPAELNLNSTGSKAGIGCTLKNLG